MSDVLAPQKRRLAAAFFHALARRRLEGAFSNCMVRGLPALGALLARGPVIVAVNHVSFWDGFLLSCLERALAADAYCLMDRANLERLSFLRFAGAVPINVADGRGSRVDLERAATLLDRPGRLLFVFPQGQQVPARLPLRFRTGVLTLAQLARAPIVPAGLSYEFLQDPKPEIRVSIGPALALQSSRAINRRHLEEAVRVELDLIDASLVPGASVMAHGFSPLLRERPQGLPMGSRLLGAISRRRAS